MNKNDKDLEKFKRVKAIIDGTAKPFIPKSTRSTTIISNGGGNRKNSMLKKQFVRTNKKSKKVVENEDEDDQFQYGDEEEDNGESELDTYKLPNRFEDEEIEEEDAFDDADEDLIKSKANKNYDDDFEGEDFVDLDELLDEKEETSSVSSKSTKHDEEEEEDEEKEDDEEEGLSDDSLFSENDDDDDDDDDEPSEQEEDDEENSNSSNLISIVKNLEKTKRSIKDENKSKTKLPDMTEVIGNESQFNIFPNVDENGTIDINDLMSFIPDEFDKVKSQLDEIADKAPISTPVSKYERDTIQRRITTEQAHKILTQWVPFVREQREKNLKFESKVIVPSTSSTLASSFSKTDLNDEISKAIMDSGASITRPPQGAIDPATGKKVVDPIEEKRRLREIIKLRSIMYYQEIKDKRKKKIKSKSFRKVEKKKKEKALAKREEELMKLDPEFAKHKAEKLEERRVLERMTQRHKNNSKFMKNILNNRGLTTDDRRDINEHQKLAKELLLMNKINNSNVNNENSDEDEDDESDDDDDDDESDDDNKNKKIDLSDVDQKSLSDKERIQMKLQKLGRPTTLPDKGINAMKFMQKSMERELDNAIKLQNGVDDYEQAELDDQEREIEESNRIILHKQLASNKQNPSNKIMSSGLLVEKAGFGNGHKVVSGSSIQIKNNNNSNTNENNDNIKKVNNKKEQQQEQKEEEEEEELDEENPWLDVKKSKKKSKKDKKKQSDEFLISLNNLNNGSKVSNNNNNNKNNNGKEVVKGNDLSNNVVNTTSNKKDNKRKFENNNINDNSNKESDEKSEKKTKTMGMSLITSNKQKELLLEAFAKDNIEDEFMEEKKQLVEEDVPEEKSNFLPGWGSWVGDGAQERDNSKKEAMLKRKRDQKVKELAQKRADSKNSRVIIDEKAPLDGVSKYVLNQLPQHYSNKEQYESTLSIAHGKDWNSSTAFRKLIEPKVSVMPGTFIKPVSIKDKQDFIMKKKEESKKKSKK
ncbi:hypothetical protein ACTFIW_006594 [Dictyostelium discoideum]